MQHTESIATIGHVNVNCLKPLFVQPASSAFGSSRIPTRSNLRHADYSGFFDYESDHRSWAFCRLPCCKLICTGGRRCTVTHSFSSGQHSRVHSALQASCCLPNIVPYTCGHTAYGKVICVIYEICMVIIVILALIGMG